MKAFVLGGFSISWTLIVASYVYLQWKINKSAGKIRKYFVKKQNQDSNKENSIIEYESDATKTVVVALTSFTLMFLPCKYIKYM